MEDGDYLYNHCNCLQKTGRSHCYKAQPVIWQGPPSILLQQRSTSLTIPCMDLIHSDLQLDDLTPLCFLLLGDCYVLVITPPGEIQLSISHNIYDTDS